jgi:sec-independent protein translocase protein TatA
MVHFVGIPRTGDEAIRMPSHGEHRTEGPRGHARRHVGLVSVPRRSHPYPRNTGRNTLPVLANIVGPELLIVLAIALVLFGSSRLPQLARSLGSAKGEFERGLHDDESPAGGHDDAS